MAEAAVIGIPHGIKGQALIGFVVLANISKEQAVDNLPQELIEAVAHHLRLYSFDRKPFTALMPCPKHAQAK